MGGQVGSEWNSPFRAPSKKLGSLPCFFFFLTSEKAHRIQEYFKIQIMERRKGSKRLHEVGCGLDVTKDPLVRPSSLLSHIPEVLLIPRGPGGDDAVMRSEDSATGVTPALPPPLRLAFSGWDGEGRRKPQPERRAKRMIPSTAAENVLRSSFTESA